MVDRIRNSLSVREAWGAQRCPGLSTRLGEHVSPKQIRDWGRGQHRKGDRPRRGESTKVTKMEMCKVWRGTV